jgi:hypothetical protein
MIVTRACLKFVYVSLPCDGCCARSLVWSCQVVVAAIDLLVNCRSDALVDLLRVEEAASEAAGDTLPPTTAFLCRVVSTQSLTSPACANFVRENSSLVRRAQRAAGVRPERSGTTAPSREDSGARVLSAESSSWRPGHRRVKSNAV